MGGSLFWVAWEDSHSPVGGACPDDSTADRPEARLWFQSRQQRPNPQVVEKWLFQRRGFDSDENSDVGVRAARAMVIRSTLIVCSLVARAVVARERETSVRGFAGAFPA